MFLCELPVGRHPVIGGFRCDAWASYIAAVCQVLLRAPSVAAWLDAHMGHCVGRLGGTGALESECVICALAESTESLGKRGRPALVTQRALVSSKFADAEGHDAAEFASKLLEAARASELTAGRAVAWGGA